jgi:hypothetical protein
MGHTEAQRWWKIVVFLFLALRLWKSVVTPAGRVYYFRWGCSASSGAGVGGASIAVDRSSMGHTMDSARRPWIEVIWLLHSDMFGCAQH